MPLILIYQGNKGRGKESTIRGHRKKSEFRMGFEPTTLRASDLEHRGSWVRIPSGTQIFSVSSYG